MSLPCHCHVIAMPLPCHCHVIAMSLPCHCHVIAMSLPCHCHVTAMSLDSLIDWSLLPRYNVIVRLARENIALMLGSRGGDMVSSHISWTQS